MFRKMFLGMTLACLSASFVTSAVADDRVDISRKGSLLVYPKVEIRWEPIRDESCCVAHDTPGCDDAECEEAICSEDSFCCNTEWDYICVASAEGSDACDCFEEELEGGPAGANGQEVIYNVTQDTFLTIVNDFPADVKVQYYFVNGDEPLDPVFCCDPQELVERGHPGWNWVDCQNTLTDDQSIYWSALTGNPHGCQPFTVLDPGTPPGRPDTDSYARPGSRVLRGFVVAWAVNDSGQEIRWNHLSGTAMLVNYSLGTAWEYNAYAYRALTSAPQGSQSDGVPGQLLMNGEEYDMNFNMLVLDFFADNYLSATDLTLMVMNLDLRQDNDGPGTTKAKFDIWNSNEVRFSGTERCITCWDQTLLRDYDAPNHFLIDNLQTDKGKARIDGLGSTVCPLSQNAALLGVKALLIGPFFGVSGDVPMVALNGNTASGGNLVGQGEDTTGFIRNDIIAEPEESNGGVNGGVSLGSLLAKPARK